jgi:hypothetical protein
MQRIAFMPWVQIETEIEVNGCRLVRYQNGGTGSTIEPTDRQSEDIARVLNCYEDGGRAVYAATLIQVDGHLISELDEEARARVFSLGALLKFVGLVRRVFFTTAYVCADNFDVFIEPIGDGIALHTRRRDGQLLTVSSREHYRAHCPAHVPAHARLEVDATLVYALASAFNEPKHEAVLRDTMFQLGVAESDDPQVSEQMQFMLMSGAIQRLLEVRSKHAEHALAKALEDTLSPVREWRPLRAVDCSREAVGRHHKDRSLREAWLRDFYSIRHAFAHGLLSSAKPILWTVAEHLILASFIIPRLVMVRLQEWGFYKLTEVDRRELRAIDRLLKLPDLFEMRGTPGDEKRAWRNAFHVCTTIPNADGTEEDHMWPSVDQLDHSQFQVHYGQQIDEDEPA